MRKFRVLLGMEVAAKVSSALSVNLLSDLSAFKKRMKKMRC